MEVPVEYGEPPSLFIHIAHKNAHLGLIYHFPYSLPIFHHHGHDTFHTCLPRFPRTRKAA